MNAAALAYASLTIVLVATALWFRAARAVRLPANRSAYVAAWAAGAAGGAAAIGLGAGWPGTAAGVVALLGGATLTLLVAISRQRAADDAIRVGEPLRAFTAPDEHDVPFSLASTAGRPILLKFFRGHW